MKSGQGFSMQHVRCERPQFEAAEIAGTDDDDSLASGPPHASQWKGPLSDENALKVLAHETIHVKLFSNSVAGLKKYNYVGPIAGGNCDSEVHLYRHSTSSRLLLIRPIGAPLQLSLIVSETEDGVHFDAVVTNATGRRVHRETINSENRRSPDMNQIGGIIKFDQFAAAVIQQSVAQGLCSPQQRVHIHSAFQTLLRRGQHLLKAVWEPVHRVWTGYVVTETQHQKECRLHQVESSAACKRRRTMATLRRS